MRKEVAPHIGLHLRSHDMSDRRHIVVGNRIDHAKNMIDDGTAQNESCRQRHRLGGCRPRDLAHEHRQNELADRRQRRAKEIEQHRFAIGLIVRQKAAKQAALSDFRSFFHTLSDRHFYQSIL